MEIRLPQEVIKYLDSVRGAKSRQAYIVQFLMNQATKVAVAKK